MKHLSHKTVDSIMDHNWDKGALRLYKGKHFIHEEFTSLMISLKRVAQERNIRLQVAIDRTSVVIRKKV